MADDGMPAALAPGGGSDGEVAASFTVTDEDAAIAKLYETGVVFKMVGARGSHQGAADDASFLFR
jgi:hypothetical protein